MVVFVSVAIRAEIYSPSLHVLRQEELCGPQDCHHFSLKHCRKAASRNILPMVVLLLY